MISDTLADAHTAGMLALSSIDRAHQHILDRDSDEEKVRALNEARENLGKSRAAIDAALADIARAHPSST